VLKVKKNGKKNTLKVLRSNKIKGLKWDSKIRQKLSMLKGDET
jgi:hypothetical protein